MSKALVIKGADFSVNALDTVTFDVIHAESISVSQSAVTFDAIGDTLQLGYTIVPSDADDPVRWESSNPAVATVVNGLITVVGVGECTISVSAGSVSASCSVGVVVELTDLGRFVKTVSSASGSKNYLTSVSTFIGNTNTSYDDRMTMCDNEASYDNLTISYEYTAIDSTTGNYKLLTTRAELEAAGLTGVVRLFDAMGFPTPIVLPPNCTKIRCVAPNAHYGAYPLFYQKDVPAYPEGSETVNRGHFSPLRALTQTIANYSFVYQQSIDFDVPDGYDSISVTWKTDGETGTTNPVDMTETQLAEFKIFAL